MLILTDVVPPALLAPRHWRAPARRPLKIIEEAVAAHPMVAMAARPARWAKARLRLVRPSDTPLVDLAPAIVAGPEGAIRGDIRTLIFLAGAAPTEGGDIVIGGEVGAERTRPTSGECRVFPAALPLRVERLERGVLPFVDLLAESAVPSAEARSILLDLGRCCALLNIFPQAEEHLLDGLRAMEARLARLWSQA